DEVRTITESGGDNWHISLSPDESLLGSGRTIWDLRTKGNSQTLLTNESVLAFAPRGRFIFLNDGVKGFKRRDLASGEEWLMAPNEWVAAAEFSPKGRWMAT